LFDTNVIGCLHDTVSKSSAVVEKPRRILHDVYLQSCKIVLRLLLAINPVMKIINHN